MWDGLKYRELELAFIMYLTRHGIGAGKVHYDGQFMWVTK